MCFQGIRSFGSGVLNMCFVARGLADVYIEYGIHCWDMAAGKRLGITIRIVLKACFIIIHIMRLPQMDHCVSFEHSNLDCARGWRNRCGPDWRWIRRDEAKSVMLLFYLYSQSNNSTFNSRRLRKWSDLSLTDCFLCSNRDAVIVGIKLFFFCCWLMLSC